MEGSIQKSPRLIVGMLYRSTFVAFSIFRVTRGMNTYSMATSAIPYNPIPSPTPVGPLVDTIKEIDTPSLVVNLDAVKRNLTKLR